MRTMTTAWALAILVAGAAVRAHAAATPEEKCQAAKNKVAGKYAACRQKAEQKLALTGDTAEYDAAILRCETKLATEGSFGTPTPPRVASGHP